MASHPSSEGLDIISSDLKMQQESAEFSENTVAERTDSQRLQPWFRTLPVRNIIPTMYRALYSSQHLNPFQLLCLAKTVLKFITQQISLNNEDIDREHQVYLDIFDAIFNKLKTVTFSEDDGYEKFLDSVWNAHNQGAVDFSNTSVPRNLVQICPSRLENILHSCFNENNNSPNPLVPLCESSPENFLKVMELLNIQYKKCEDIDSIVQNQVLNFTSNFLNLLKIKLKESYPTIYPSPFHPLLHFVTLMESIGGEKSFQNELVISEILTLVDNLVYQCELFKFDVCLLLFTLYALPQVSLLIRQRNNANSITYKKWPWLKRVLRNESVFTS